MASKQTLAKVSLSILQFLLLLKPVAELLTRLISSFGGGRGYVKVG